MAKNKVNFGIEYEIENSHEVPRLRGWRKESDGTLRNNGHEFLFSGKADLTDSIDRVNRLINRLNDYDISVSHRCSTHIHVDTTSLVDYQRVSLYLGLVIHDEWFFNSDPSRSLNNFCCPVLYSPVALSGIGRAVRAYNWNDEGCAIDSPLASKYPPLADEDNKYSSVNAMPLNNLGTIELRHFSPVLDLDVIKDILCRVSDIYDIAATVDPSDKQQAIDIWDGCFKGEFIKPTTWVHNMYAMYHRVVGEKLPSTNKKPRAAYSPSVEDIRERHRAVIDLLGLPQITRDVASLTIARGDE